MINGYSIPSLTTIGLLFGGSIAAFGTAVWFIVTAETDYETNSFPPLLIGMILLVVALALFALRAINLRQGPTPPA